MELNSDEFNLPIHEDDSVAEATVTHAPHWDRLRKDADGGVLQVDAAS